MEGNKSIDVFGIKPVGEALNTTVNKTFEGIEGFLKAVCLPALEEVGLMFRDQVKSWRLSNILRILEKSKGKLNYDGNEIEIYANPRVALSIIENGSLIDSDEVQELWAGLFVSSCNESGQNDENLVFIDLLKQLTVVEAQILKFSCINAQKVLYKNGLLSSTDLMVDCNQLIQLTGVTDIHRLDRELDHMRSLELITTGFSLESEDLIADITPTTIALNLYASCQGSNENVVNFWKDSTIDYE